MIDYDCNCLNCLKIALIVRSATCIQVFSLTKTGHEMCIFAAADSKR